MGTGGVGRSPPLFRLTNACCWTVDEIYHTGNIPSYMHSSQIISKTQLNSKGIFFPNLVCQRQRMIPFSQQYTVRRRIPVPLSSDDSSVEIPLSQGIRTESPIQFPDSPGDVMDLGHSSPSPPILKSQRRSTEDATLSNVASPRYVG
ncbi:hypothetical protein FGIG_00546 [Fasciola gigantica]|uniref:Uncharacterized protein n=1 Tax=Fasciola gigantica TaxID=46835 RepID=A0A504Z2S8_FASGI|nr:hypothetical protein FGIG_00546 [Fasciola gigantica]